MVLTSTIEDASNFNSGHGTRTNECPICFEEVTIPFKTECNHQFCYPCFLNLRTENNTLTCPTCRKHQNFSSIKLDLTETQLLKHVYNLNPDVLTTFELNKNLPIQFYSSLLQLMCISSNTCMSPDRITFYKYVSQFYPIQARLAQTICQTLSTTSHQFAPDKEYYKTFSNLADMLAPTIKSLGLDSGVPESIFKYNQSDQMGYKIRFVGFDPIATTVTLGNDGGCDVVMNLLQYHIYSCGEIMFEKYMSRGDLLLIARAQLSLDVELGNVGNDGMNLKRLDLLFHDFGNDDEKVILLVKKLRSMIPEFQLLEFNMKHIAQLVRHTGSLTQEDLISKMECDMSFEELFSTVQILASNFNVFRVSVSPIGNLYYNAQVDAS